jgi:phosphatidate cytidylyltransferase
MITRLITGSILFVICSSCILLGGYYFLGLVVVSTLIALYELIKMSAPAQVKTAYLPMAAIMGTLLLLAYFKPLLFNFWGIEILILFTLILMGKELICKSLSFQNPICLRCLRAVLILSATCPFLILIRNSPDGIIWTLYCLLIIAASDSFALFGGRLYGKHPLTTISPKKTREGSLTGLLMSGVCSMAFMTILPIHPIGLFGLGVVISLFAQLGDLHESLTKRVYQVKDSSNLLPGHGGFYDRLDSYLMVLPVVYYLVYGGIWL